VKARVFGKPGDEVAVKATYDAAPISGIHRHSVIVERGSIEVAYVDDDQLAPFLSVEDQSSLLRVVKAAERLRQTGDSAPLFLALHELPDPLFARLSEGE
jgi:hypothetical protein